MGKYVVGIVLAAFISWLTGVPANTVTAVASGQFALLLLIFLFDWRRPKSSEQN